MKIARFLYDGIESYGFVIQNRVLEADLVSRLLGIELPETIEEFIKENHLPQIRDQYTLLERSMEKGIEISHVQLLAPLKNPPKIVCLGCNYFDHVEEIGGTIPQEPVIFMKPRTSIADPFEDIEVPSDYTKQVDYEGELAIVIGTKGKRIPKEEAMNYVFGYLVFNDVTARDIQRRDGQWTRGKSLDKFAPIGPWIVTSDEIQNPHELRIITKVNDEVRQDSSTLKMIFKIPDIIHILSKGMTFEPGDIIATGTPAGVGYFWRPKPKLLKHGDVVEIFIERIGKIRNKFLFV
ncbi:MAG: fumarylacetoacetate hydrolase family protein [Candidatus Njordarchaeales archaeon]